MVDIILEHQYHPGTARRRGTSFGCLNLGLNSQSEAPARRFTTTLFVNLLTLGRTLGLTENERESGTGWLLSELGSAQIGPLEDLGIGYWSYQRWCLTHLGTRHQLCSLVALGSTYEVAYYQRWY